MSPDRRRPRSLPTIALLSILFLIALVGASYGHAGKPHTSLSVPQAGANPSGGCAGWHTYPYPGPGGSSVILFDVWATSAADIWAVGLHGSAGQYQPLTQHWDGAQWSIVPGPEIAGELYGVGGASSDDVWAVGYHPDGVAGYMFIIHWDGQTWSLIPGLPQVPAGQLFSIAAISADDVWAVGAYANTLGQRTGLSMHWDGQAWAVIPLPLPIHSDIAASDSPLWLWDALYSVEGIAADDVWAVGEYQSGSITRPLTLHWDGFQWSAVSTPDVGAGRLWSISVVSSTDVWAVGSYTNGTNQPYLLRMHWGGQGWSVVPGPSVILPSDFDYPGVSAAATDDVWVVSTQDTNGQYGMLVTHWDGAGWSEVPGPGGPAGHSAVAAIAVGDVWAANGAQMAHYTNTCATPTPSPTATATPGTMLVGHVTWQGRPAQPHTGQQLPITLTLSTGSTQVIYPQRITDPYGYFTVPLGSLPGGTYTWRAKGPQHLSNSGSVALERSVNPHHTATRVGALNLPMFQGTNVPTTDVEMGLMRAGDIDGSDVVDVLDFTALKATFGLSSADPGYDARCDLNGDDLIDIRDFALLAGNFGETGSGAL